MLPYNFVMILYHSNMIIYHGVMKLYHAEMILYDDEMILYCTYTHTNIIIIVKVAFNYYIGTQTQNHTQIHKSQPL